MEKPKVRNEVRKIKKVKTLVSKLKSIDEGIFIPMNVPSSKNGRRWTGKYSIGSKTTVKYYKSSEQDYIKNRNKFINMLEGLKKPYKISFQFVRGSKHKFDYLNPAQTIQDRMVTFKWIDDDNADEMLPIFLPYTYDKLNPGVWINVIKNG